MKTYTGKEWKEKWKNNPDLKGMKMREEPPDWKRIDENGTPVDPVFDTIVGLVGFVLLLAFSFLVLQAVGIL